MKGAIAVVLAVLLVAFFVSPSSSRGALTLSKDEQHSYLASYTGSTKERSLCRQSQNRSCDIWDVL